MSAQLAKSVEPTIHVSRVGGAGGRDGDLAVLPACAWKKPLKSERRGMRCDAQRSAPQRREVADLTTLPMSAAPAGVTATFPFSARARNKPFQAPMSTPAATEGGGSPARASRVSGAGGRDGGLAVFRACQEQSIVGPDQRTPAPGRSWNSPSRIYGVGGVGGSCDGDLSVFRARQEQALRSPDRRQNSRKVVIAQHISRVGGVGGSCDGDLAVFRARQEQAILSSDEHPGARKIVIAQHISRVGGAGSCDGAISLYAARVAGFAVSGIANAALSSWSRVGNFRNNFS